MANGGDSVPNVHSDSDNDSNSHTLLKSDALYKGTLPSSPSPPSMANRPPLSPITRPPPPRPLFTSEDTRPPPPRPLSTSEGAVNQLATVEEEASAVSRRRSRSKRSRRRQNFCYVLDTTVLPREPECMRDLRLLTDKHKWGFMASSPDEAQLLGMLIKMAGAKNTIEVGVFTGYSLLATALALPDDGTVVAIDHDRESYEAGRPFIEKAGVAHKVDFREGAGLERLEELLAEEAAAGHEARFDFAFVDADKPNYVRYHEQLLRLVRVGGTIVYDNTLWGGTVALPPDAPMSDLDRRISVAIRDLNAKLAADPRIEVCQLTIADGVTICRRLV